MKEIRKDIWDELSLAISHDGSLLAPANFDRMVYLWDLGAQNLIQVLEFPNIEYYSAMEVCSNQDGSPVFVSNSSHNIFMVWETKTDRMLKSFTIPDPQGIALPYPIALSHDGGLLAFGGQDGILRVFGIQQ